MIGLENYNTNEQKLYMTNSTSNSQKSVKEKNNTSKAIGIKGQLMLFIFLILSIVLTCIFYISYTTAKEQVLNVGEEMFTNVLKDAVGLVDALNERVKAGDMTLEQAQEMAKEYIVGPKMPDGNRDISKTKMSTNDYMYLWGITPEGIATMHPFNLEGVNIWDYQIEGKYTVRDTWGNPKATGYPLREIWQNPGEPIYTFMAYQAYYKPWNWVIGAGGREQIIYERRLRGMQIVFLISAAISLTLSMLFSYILASFIAKRIQKIKFVVEKASEGDLREKVDLAFKDEFGILGDDFNKMANNLREMMKHVSNSSVKVAESAKEMYTGAEHSSAVAGSIAKSIQQVAVNTESQLVAFTENKRAMLENAQAVAKIAESTATVSDLANGVLEKVQEGRNVIGTTIKQMAVVNSSVSGISSSIHVLGENSKAIGQIVETINQIASQTNLLALNAAIEAARAGEQGRGFAVVADEVRKLAERSEDATKQISVLIGEIQKNTTSAVAMMENGSREVDQGVSMVNEVGQTFERIAGSIEKVTDEMQGVSATTEEISASTEELNASTEQLAQISNGISDSTQAIAASSEEQLASSEEVTAAANNLGVLADELKSEIEKFKI